VAEREVLNLGADAIHSVENPQRGLTGGLHVYGGDMLRGERSSWDPGGREVRSTENLARRMEMVRAIYKVAAERGLQLDDDAQCEARLALRAACERERRYPTMDEARRIIEDAWKPRR
jgi:hypothetical protein